MHRHLCIKKFSAFGDWAKDWKETKFLNQRLETFLMSYPFELAKINFYQIRNATNIENTSKE